jgi:radical SAM superfamily enzyme YgiQ (UPF0313 family)
MVADHCNVLMIYPRFNAGSFWNYQATCQLAGARYPAAPLGLITVAALLPKSWDVRLVNRNTETLTDDDLDWAEMVMTGGMHFQQADSLHLIELCRERGKPVVVGGPDVTSTPDFYHRANFRVLGEAEEIMDDFVTAWRDGKREGEFLAPMGQTDVTKSPTPRFDLLKFDHYLHVGVQFSRGCPFNCEFCDIIELYGRVPRSKTTAQVLAELDALHALGYRGHIDFVDDNLIGNKKALRKFLPELQNWMKKKQFPFEFSTEASVNLSDDEELLRELRAANFFAVFVGIESPDTDTLILTRKKQNTRRSLQDSIYKIYDAGIFVLAGFIVGFDSENAAVADGMIECIEDLSIPVCTVGLLYALPHTQLTRRLAHKGRLFADHHTPARPDQGDQCTSGLNFLTKRPRRDVLVDYKTVVGSVYHPAAFFGRVRRMGRMLRPGAHKLKTPLRKLPRDIRSVRRLIWHMLRAEPELRRQFIRTIVEIALHNPRALLATIKLSSLYVHLGPFARQVTGQIQQQIDDIDTGRWTMPEMLVPPAISPATETAAAAE